VVRGASTYHDAMDNFSPVDPMAPQQPFPWLAVIGGAVFFFLIVFGMLFFFVPGFNPLNIVGVQQEELLNNTGTAYTDYYVIRIAQSADLRDAQDLVESVGGEVSYILSRSRVIVARITEDEKSRLEQDERVVWVERQQKIERSGKTILLAQADRVPAAASEDGIDVFIIDTGAGSIPGLNYASKSGVQITYESGERVDVGIEDTLGHGTKVAYAFQTYLKNASGVRMHSIKDGDEDGTVDMTAEAIFMAIEQGAEVVNISSGSFGGGDTQIFNEAIDAAKAAGVVVVVAAGNESGLKGENYLTQDPYVISAGALNANGTVADYSDGLIAGDEADVFALGDVALPGEETAQGTSFAAPRVSGAIAQFMAQPIPSTFDADGDGRWDPDEVRERLKDGVRKGEFPVMRDGEEVVASVTAAGSIATDAPSSGATSTPITGGTVGTTGTVGSGGPVVGGNTVFGGDTTFGGNTTYGIDGGSSEGTSGSGGSQSSTLGGSGSGGARLAQQNTNALTFPQDEGSGGLVPCGDSSDQIVNGVDNKVCQICHVEVLARDTLKLVIYVAVFMATLMIAYAGFKMVTAQGDSSAITEAKAMLLKVIIGLFIVLAAWLIVDTLMRVFFRTNAYPGALQWYDFGSCLEQPRGNLTGQAPPEETGGVGVGSQQNPFVSTGKKGSDAENRALLNSLGIPVNKTESQGTSLEGTDQNLLKTLGEIKTATGEKYTVTGGSENVHQNVCHRGGSCIDVVCTTCGDDPTKINNFIKAAQSKNYCAVYEPGPGNSCPAGVSPCLTGVGTGKHFSLYMSPTQSPSCNR